MEKLSLFLLFAQNKITWKHVIICVFSVFLFFSSAQAQTMTWDLVYEFDGELTQQVYGRVTIEEVDDVYGDNDGTNLYVTIQYNTASSFLGDSADIHLFYIDLGDNAETIFPGIKIYTTDTHFDKKGKTVLNEYTWTYDTNVTAGAGAANLEESDFGDGKSSNGTLQSVTFTLDSTVALSLDDLDLFTWNNMPEGVTGTQVAVHFQSTSTSSGSEMIGGAVSEGGSNSASENPVPEPETILLFGCALLGLSGINRRKVKNIH